MTRADLIATAQLLRGMPSMRMPYVERFLLGVLAHLDGDAPRLRDGFVGWAKTWRSEECSRLSGCDPHDGSHDYECAIEVNERDGIALLDALAIAEDNAAKESQ